MTVTIVRGDIFTSRVSALVNPINCVGTMGKGLAREFARRFTGLDLDYRSRCLAGKVKIGEPYIYYASAYPPSGRSDVINFPTKDHWRDPSRYEYISSGLIYLAGKLEEWNVESLALPALGCGEGGLEWQYVRNLISNHLGYTGVPTTVYLL